MRKKPFPIQKVTGGLDTREDPIFLADKSAVTMNCGVFSKGIVKKDVGFANFGADPANAYPLGGIPMKLDEFYLAGGSSYTLCLTTTLAHKYMANGKWETFNRVSEGGNAVDVPFTGNISNPWSTTAAFSNAGNDWYLFTNGIDDVQYWPGGTNKAANLPGVDSANANIQAKAIAQFKTCTFLGGTIEDGTACPLRVRWSNFADPEDWTIALGGPGFVDLADTIDWVVAYALLGDRMFVFKERSIWEMAYIGGAAVFTPRLVVDGIGTYAPHSIVSLGNVLLFYGTDGIYEFDGRQVKSVGEQVRGLLYEADTREVDASKASRVVSQYIEELGSYYLILPTTGDYPNLFLTYNLDYDAWSRRNKEYTAIGFYTVPSGTRWQDGTGTWANQTERWSDKKLISGAPTTLLATSDGYIVEDNRQTNAANEAFTFVTKDFYWDHAVRVVEFRAQIKSDDDFWVQYSTDRGNSWSITYPFSNKANFSEISMPINITCQQIRFRIYSEANQIEFKWIEPWYITRARSQTVYSS